MPFSIMADIKIQTRDQADYICLTDIARYKDERTDYIIQNWLRNRDTIDFLGIWEQLNNPGFNPIEFDGIKRQAGSNSFILTAKQWIEKTRAIGITSKAGRYGGTYAHKDIAFEFASWLNPSFKLLIIKEFQRLKTDESARLGLYLIKEFQRLKEEEHRQLGWDIKRNLAKINCRIHTDAIKANLIPAELSKEQTNFVYASEADVLNMALFGMAAKAWRECNPGLKGNIRDEANAAQLVCLSNLENLNALFIREGQPQARRLARLNQIAIEQMKLLSDDAGVKRLGKGKG